MQTLLIILDAVLAVATMAAILLQTGYSPGISGAFGGGSAPQMYGKKKGVDEFLARVTTFLAIAFGLVTLILAHIWH